jgi:hypothetical protein
MEKEQWIEHRFLYVLSDTTCDNRAGHLTPTRTGLVVVILVKWLTI